MILKRKLAVCLCFALRARHLRSGSGAAGEKAAAKRTLVRAGHVLDVKTGKLADAQTIVVVGDTHPVDRVQQRL